MMRTVTLTGHCSAGAERQPHPRIELGRQVLRFAAVGVASTLAYLVLYVGLRYVMSAQLANALALLVTAVANTTANRRLTFGVSGRESRARQQIQGLVVFAIGLGVTSGSLALMHVVSATPPRSIEVAVLVVANALATVIRFVALRVWVFGGARSTEVSAVGG